MAERLDPGAPRARPAAVDGAAFQPTEAQVEAVFARRAEMLARPLPEAGGAGPEALVFALGAERYAFPTWQVLEVRPIGQVTRLPGTPPFVAGIVNVRGRIVPVLDLRPVFGLAPGGDAVSVLLIAGPRGDVGLVATGRPEVHPLPPGPLGELPPGAPPGLQAGYVRGVTEDLLVVLDAEALLADPRLVVQEESR